ncbi:MAG: histone H1 [Promethearchaeota archaeon]|jgi:hypothetical protein
MTEYDKLKELIDGCSGDVAKADKGNRSAGTRVRKAMQDIKKQAQEVREAILKLRDA